jgi:photosystem II stability/assembly factor-like uncharacterized protein
VIAGRTATRPGTVPADRPWYLSRSHAGRTRFSLAVLAGLLLAVTFVAVVAHAAHAHVPHDDVADLAVSPSFDEDRTALAIVRGKLMRSTDGGRTWQEMVRGLGDETQVLDRISIAPSDPDVAYLTTQGDGVLRSEDGGKSWRPTGRGIVGPLLRDLAVSPTSPDTVLVAGAVGGLFRTTDGGLSWSVVDGSGWVRSLAFLADGSRLLIGDAKGRITASDDGGATWDAAAAVARGDAVTAIATGTTGRAVDTVFAGTASGRVLRSDDGGRTFAPLDTGLPAEEIRSLELSPEYADDTTVWASTWHSGVFQSTDEGETWERTSAGLTTDPQADDVGVPQFRAVVAGIEGSGRRTLLVAGFDGLFRRDQGDARWTPVEVLADHIVGLALSPDFAHDGTVAVTTYVKGAFVSHDGGTTWEPANAGLTLDDVGPGNKFAPLWRLHNVVYSPDYPNDHTVFSANWVRVVRSTDGGASWAEIEVGPPPPGDPLRQFVLAVSPSYASDRTVFAATRHGEVFRSEGGGGQNSWARVGSLPDRVRSLAVSPHYVDDRVLYAGTVSGVFASADAGGRWHPVGPRVANAPQGRETDPGALVAISPAYDRDGTVFAGTDSGLFVTRDAGRSWTEVTAEPLTASSGIEAVAISPDYQNDRTVVISTREHGLLRSTAGGRSFRAVGTELLRANHLVADFSNPTSAPIQFSPTFASDHTIFAYGQGDVLRSTDGGDCWQVLTLPSSGDVLESLGRGANAPSAAPASDAERRRFDPPIADLSLRRLLAAGAAGLAGVALLRGLGVGGRRTGRALALHLGGGVVVVGVALLLLAAW